LLDSIDDNDALKEMTKTWPMTQPINYNITLHQSPCMLYTRAYYLQKFAFFQYSLAWQWRSRSWSISTGVALQRTLLLLASFLC